jgi:hypothetical protein
MPLEVGKPILDSVTRVHKLSITDCPPFEYVTKITDRVELDAVAEQFTTFVEDFLQKASKYFSQSIDMPLFLQRIQHTYEGEQNESGEDTQVSWIPAFVLFYPNRYVIHWKLISTENPPGKTHIIEQSSEPTPVVEAPATTAISPVRTRREIRKKIRQARLKSALAELYLKRLTHKYYEKYGNFSGLEESESDLSSESDVE